MGAAADETLLCRTYITAVPYTITRPGHYCLAGNLSTAMTTGAAISIRSDSVWLDLNNFILDGSAAGVATEADGIDSFNQRDLVVRNGVVRGFSFGVDLETLDRGRNYTVENIRAERNTVAGIFLTQYGGPGGGHIIRDNIVMDTGGSTTPGAGAAFGIVLGGGGRVSNNEIVNVFAPHDAIAIDLREGTAIVSANRVSESKMGVACQSAGKFLRDNVAIVSGLAYGPLCTPIGTTNFP
jgi:hypothetical protein